MCNIILHRISTKAVTLTNLQAQFKKILCMVIDDGRHYFLLTLIRKPTLKVNNFVGGEVLRILLLAGTCIVEVL